MTLQEKLQFIRKVTGKTQEKLAQELGVSFVAFNRWQNGRSVPRKKQQAKINALFLELSGQKKIPSEALQAKKLLLANQKRSYPDALKVILSRKDIHDEFVLELTYHTNRIEGSSLTEPETAAILFQNAALPNKGIIEQLEVKNHQTALQFLFKHVAEKGRIDEAFILRLHAILMNSIREDAGSYRKHGVRIVGANVVTANPLKVPERMRHLFRKIQKRSTDVIAHGARIHSEFEQIHPFSDGNGRIGRLLLNAMLLKEKFPPAIIRQGKRRFYMLYLNQSQLESKFDPFEDFLCDAVMDGFDLMK